MVWHLRSWTLVSTWKRRMRRTSSWNAWSTFIRFLAEHSMNGVFNCFAMSSQSAVDTWRQSVSCIQCKKIWGCQPTLIGIFFDISWRPKTHASKLERLWSDEAYKWPHRLACLAHGHNICSMPANQGPMQSAYCLTTPTQMNPTILSFTDIILISR